MYYVLKYTAGTVTTRIRIKLGYSLMTREARKYTLSSSPTALLILCTVSRACLCWFGCVEAQHRRHDAVHVKLIAHFLSILWL